jgi:hypothetical protein
MDILLSHQLIEETNDVPLTKGGYLASPTIQRSISRRIESIVNILVATARTEDPGEKNIDRSVREALVSDSLFDFLIDEEQLPDYQGDYRIIYELDAFHIVVDIMPSACHDYCAFSFTGDLLRWTESGGVLDTMEVGGRARTPLIYLSLTLLVFPWAIGSKKSPDNSFRPAQLQSPPGKLIGNSNVLYPNFTVEVAKSQSWDSFLADAELKHFAEMTGIVVWLGIKIYPTRRMRVCLLERDMTRGSGPKMPLLACTGFIDISVPCQDSIVIPKRLLYYGVPNAAIPPTQTPDYILDLEIIRRSVNKNFQATDCCC